MSAVPWQCVNCGDRLYLDSLGTWISLDSASVNCRALNQYLGHVGEAREPLEKEN